MADHYIAPAVYRPSELAARWRCSLDSVYSMIRAGSLRAFVVSKPAAKRKSYRVPADAVAEHESRRSTSTRPPTRRRKIKSQRADYVEFF